MHLPWTTNVLTYPTELDIITLDIEDKHELKGMLEKLEVPNTQYILQHLKATND